MHEFSIARALVDLACEQARSAGLSSVTRVKCRIGELRQVEPDMLDDAFEAVRGGTACSAAVLEMESVRLRAECPQCHRVYPVQVWEWHCPACGTAGRPLEGGDELELVAIQGRIDADTTAAS